MSVIREAGFYGANIKIEPRLLSDGVGVSSVNQKPSESGDFRPWREPLTIAGPVIPSGRQTIYRMGRDVPSNTSYWLSWSVFVQVMRGFDSPDPTERTYFTGNGAPQWTDNTIGLVGTPYPSVTRLLAVPQPTIAPTVTMNTDGPDGEPRRLYYCFTWVNDIGWESAPSPPALAPLALPGAILDLTVNEAVPAGNYGVDRVRWYRTQTTGAEGDAEFFFLREYTVGAPAMQDDARSLGTDVLPTAPNTLRLPLPTTAYGLTRCWNDFAAALADKTIRFCEPGLVYSWPLGNEYSVPDTPVAIAVFSQRAVVLTTAGAELFVGSDPEAMDQKPLALPAIVSARSLVLAETFCMYATNSGLHYYGVDGERNLTAECLKPEQWRALVPSTIVGGYFEISGRPVYVGFYNDGALKGFVVDPQNPRGIYWLDKGYTSCHWDPLQRKLFVLDGALFKQWDASGSFMAGTWRGRIHRSVEHTEAEWLEVMGNGSATVKVFTEAPADVDDTTPLVQRMSRSVTRGVHRVPDGTTGRDWQAEFTTSGAVTGLVVE